MIKECTLCATPIDISKHPHIHHPGSGSYRHLGCYIGHIMDRVNYGIVLALEDHQMAKSAKLADELFGKKVTN